MAQLKLPFAISLELPVSVVAVPETLFVAVIGFAANRLPVTPTAPAVPRFDLIATIGGVASKKSSSKNRSLPVAGTQCDEVVSAA